MFILRGIAAFAVCDYRTDTLDRVQQTMEKRIQELKTLFGTQMMAFPQIKYQLKGDQISLSFIIDSRRGTLASTATLLQNIPNAKLLKTEEKKLNNLQITQYDFQDDKGDFRISLIGPTNDYFYQFEYTKASEFSQDYERLIEIYKIANQAKAPVRQSGQRQEPIRRKAEDPIETLEQLGARVYKPESTFLDWDYLAGAEEAKREIEDTILLALQRPDIFDKITEVTRVKNEPNRPKAVLFEGPPGTGKTTSAKIIAHQVKIPLVYVGLEAIMSKWYGEAEKNLGKVFEGCAGLGKCMIFIDEIDSLAQSRDKDMHEATRRLLSLFLRHLDGFESNQDVIVICATNRKSDLDPALQSRFSKVIEFPYPDKHSRKAIFERYARHLDNSQLTQLAEHSNSFTGRDIKSVCEDAERKWAAFILRGESSSYSVPFALYLSCLNSRKKAKDIAD